MPPSLPILPRLLLAISALAILAAALNDDAALLLQFKAAFTNGNTVLYNWTSSSQDPCASGRWIGVQCASINNNGVNETRVIEL